MAKKALEGKRIALTRSKDQMGSLIEKVEALGGEVIELPLIDVEPYCDPSGLDDVFEEMSGYEWLVFTSANGVRHFFEFFFNKFKDIRCICGVRIACVGSATAREVESFHLQVDLVPEVATADGLADKLIEQEAIDNLKMLLVVGNRNRDTLVTRLEDEGHAIVDRVQVYETIMNDLSEEPGAVSFRELGADAIVFASSSAVQSFVDQTANLKIAEGARQPVTCSIGPQTSETMREKGLPMDMEAEQQSLDGIVEALVKWF